MRQYEYTVGSPVDMDGSGKPSYPVLCRSWDDFDQDAESWTRVVNWFTRRDTAQIEADAFNANHAERVAAQAKQNQLAGFPSVAEVHELISLAFPLSQPMV